METDGKFVLLTQEEMDNYLNEASKRAVKEALSQLGSTPKPRAYKKRKASPRIVATPEQQQVLEALVLADVARKEALATIKRATAIAKEKHEEIFSLTYTAKTMGITPSLLARALKIAPKSASNRLYNAKATPRRARVTL